MTDYQPNTPVTVGEAVTLAAIITACQRNARVGYVDDTARDGVSVGTLRSVGDDLGNYSKPGQDVRECFVRITMRSGFENFMPVRKACMLLDTTEFVLDYSG